MSGLVYTLLTDGTSDRALDRVVRWTLRRFDVRVERGVWADPKSKLFDLLLEATEHQGRKRERARRDLRRMRHRVAELTDGFEPLIGVPAFDRFRADMEKGLKRLGLL